MKAVKFIVIALVLIGVGVFFMFNYRQDLKRRQQEEAAALASARQTAGLSLQAIESAVASAAEAETAARERKQKAAQAVQSITGRPFSRRPEKKYLSAPRAPRPAARPAEEKKADEAPKTKEEAELPPGMLTKEQIERMRAAQMKAKGAEKPKEKPPEPAPQTGPLVPEDLAPEKAAPAASPRVVHKEPEIVILARSVVMEAEDVIANADRLRNLREEATTVANQAMAAIESRTAASHAKRLQGMQAVAAAVRAEIEEALTRTNEPYEKTLTMKQTHAETMALRKKQQERLLKEEELRQQTQRELGQVGTMHNRAREHLKTYSYGQALTETREAAEALQTPAAQKAAAVIIESYERMQGLQEFLIQRINARRFRWGWGHGPAAKDVIGASETALQITGQAIPWDQVPLPQMLRLLRHYVDDKNLDRRERAQQQLALAIFLIENGLNDPAESLVRTMRDQYPTMHDDMDRLLPF